MRLATYNIWNENKGKGNRTEQIIAEIKSVNADIIGLQEVTRPIFDILTENLDYSYHAFFMYRNEDEGLAFFSRFPLEDAFFLNGSPEYSHSDALNVLFKAEGFTFSITNLHLPWDSILIKEKQIVAIDKFIKTQKDKAIFL